MRLSNVAKEKVIMQCVRDTYKDKTLELCAKIRDIAIAEVKAIPANKEALEWYASVPNKYKSLIKVQNVLYNDSALPCRIDEIKFDRDYCYTIYGNSNSILENPLFLLNIYFVGKYSIKLEEDLQKMIDEANKLMSDLTKAFKAFNTDAQLVKAMPWMKKYFVQGNEASTALVPVALYDSIKKQMGKSND